MKKFISCTILAYALASCTMSYQNISTHGEASDVVDENQTATPDIKADITANMPPLKPPLPFIK